MSIQDKYRICIIVPKGNPHAACFTEAALLLKNTLASLKYDCDITINNLSDSNINILFGAHLLNPELFRPSSRYIIYQAEQLSDNEGWYSDAKLSLFRNAYDVWDYSIQNCAFLEQHSIQAKHLPLGYHIALEQIAQNNKKDIDILFFGSLNERRKQIIKNLEQKNLTVKTLFGIYGTQRDAIIARSKIILNIHFYSMNIFESVRVSYLLNNRCFVVSEYSPDYPYPGVEIPAVPYDKLTETCTYYLHHSELLEQKAETMYQQFKTLYPMEKMLEKILP